MHDSCKIQYESDLKAKMKPHNTRDATCMDVCAVAFHDDADVVL